MADAQTKIVLTAVDQTRAAFQSAKNNLKDMERSAFDLKGTLAGLTGGLVGTAIVAFGKNVLDSADALNDMSQRTGVTVKDLASLRTAAEQNGTSLEDVGKSIQKLNLSFSQAQAGSKETNAALQRLGITSSDARERFFQLSDAYVKAGGDSRVLADIQKVLGKQYADMIPLLSQGGDGLREAAKASESFAATMARLAPDADKFNDQLSKLKEHAAGAAGSILSELVQSLSQYLQTMNEVIERGSTLDKINFFTLGYASADVLDKVTPGKERIDQYNAKLRELNAEIEKIKGAWLSSESDLRIGLLEKQIADLTARRNALIEQVVSEQNKPHISKVTPPAGGGGGGDKNTKKADPLASLLGSTDIGKLRDFEEKVALLNQRFDYGRKSTELYEQAMTKLVESTFANNFKEAANDAEFMAMVQEDGAKTAAEWAQNLRDLKNVDMNRLKGLLENTDFARLKQDQEDMILLAQAFAEGIKDADGNLRKLSEAEYLDAVKNRLKLVGEEATETKSIFEEMGIVMVSHLEDAISGGNDMSDVLKAMERDVANLIIRLSVMEPLMNGIKGIFSSTGSGSSGGSGFNLGNIFQTAVDWIFSANGNVFNNAPGLSAYSSSVVNKPTVFPFAKGMGLMGEAGPEAIMPLTRMGNGKLGVMAANDGGGVVVNVINNANGTQATTNERTDQNGNRIIDVMIEQVKGSIAGDISNGRGAIPAALGNTYGLNRVAGAY